MDEQLRVDSVPEDGRNGIPVEAAPGDWYDGAVTDCERRLWRLVTSATAAAVVAASRTRPARKSNGERAPSAEDGAPVSSEERSASRFDLGSRKLARARLTEMMREILESADFQHPPEEDPWTSTWCVTFPSDLQWQDGIYKKMLEKQRLRRLELQEFLEEHPDEKMEDVLQRNEAPGGSKVVLHEWNIVPAKTKKAPFHAPQAARLAKTAPIGPGPITWTIEDLANAGRLLNTPPLPVDFQDEQEMRRVYTLIYDVFRYKNILSQSLDDVLFFVDHPDMSPLTSRVWLLLFDMYHRSFRKRTPAHAQKVAELFPEAGLQLVDDVLRAESVRLAAAIARIRIKNKALRLSQLLPHHLRDEKTLHRIETPLTCWVNIKKLKTNEDLTTSLAKSLEASLVDEATSLTSATFKWDPHCPHFMVFHPSLRDKLAQSKLVKRNKLIVQDKSFCLGPATFVKIVSDLQLTGSVIQSHVNSPRTTAYLASILSQNDNIKKLLAFSAGSRKSEYESYFNELGIKNILIFEEKMIDMPPDSNSLEEVIAVFATPPNSYSAVADPIDFVCSRGGDLALLEVLTETEDTAEGRKRVARILDEQKKTLKFAMSRPQIQFVLYETHSEIPAENDQMIQKTLKEINKCARIHHAVVQGKLKAPQAQRELMTEGKEVVKSISEDSMLEEKRNRALHEVVVPECDLFDVSNLPDLCPNTDGCLNLSDKGCYLALVQRKQVTRMDNKYMIQMAENRGVFGDPNKTARGPAKKRVENAINSPVNKPKRRVREFEVERLQIATKASMGHTKLAAANEMACPKMCTAAGANAVSKVSQSRRWWAETTRHITSVRASVSKQAPWTKRADDHQTPPSKLLNNNNINNNIGDSLNMNHKRVELAPAEQQKAQRFVNRVWLKSATSKVDEMVARSRRDPHQIPIHPRLRLSRATNAPHENKVPVPVAVTMVTFPPTRHYWA